MHAPSQPPAGDFSIDRRRLAVTACYCALIGVAAALVAKILLMLIGTITHLAYDGTLQAGLVQPDPHHWGWPAIFIPVAGGLAVGLIARFGSDKIRGHGIPEAIQSILEGNSVIPARVALLKPIASAITIGTGGPFGAEGPIIMTGGAIGSLFAQFFHLTSFERRTLLVAGAAGGMSATFGSPIAAVLVAVELLLFEWRPRSFIPVAVASFVAYVVRIPLLGSASPFLVAHPHAIGASGYGWALLLGVAAAGVSMLMTRLVYLAEDAYHRLPIHWMWWPAIGGAIVGVGGWFAPDALGVGYPTIRSLLEGHLVASAVVALIVVKIVIWIASLSSGTSGGVLAPLLMIGAGLGALASQAIPGHDAGAWAAVGMAATLGGTMRAPFMATIFTIETTHAWGLLPAAFVGCVVAPALTVAFVPRSILTERLARRGMHVAREYSVHPLELIAVADVMTPRSEVATLSAGDTIATAQAVLSRGPEPPREYPVVDERGRAIGLVSRDRIDGCAGDGAANAPLRSIVTPARSVLPTERARQAANVMAESRSRALLVTDERGTWLGCLTADSLLDAWRRGLSAETRRRRVRTWRRPAVRRAT